MKSLKAVILLILITITSSVSFSQTNIDSTEVYGTILKRTPFAFQFAVGNDLTLKNFANFNISVKKHFSPGFGLRFSAGFNYSNEDLSGTLVDQDFTLDRTEKNLDNLFSSEIDILFYFNPRSIVKAYMGIGPYFSYSWFSQEEGSNFSLNNEPASYFYRAFKETSLGGALLFGAEWFFAKKFSLFTEYNFLFTYSWITETYIIDNSNNYFVSDLSGNETSFRGDALKFGLSVYF